MDLNAFERAVRRTYIKRWMFVVVGIVITILLLGVGSSIEIAEESPPNGTPSDLSTTSSQSSEFTSSTEETTSTTSTQTGTNTNINGSVSFNGTGVTDAQPSTATTFALSETMKTTTETNAAENNSIYDGNGSSDQEGAIILPLERIPKSFIWLLCFFFGTFVVGSVLFTQMTPPSFVNQLLKDNLPAKTIKRRYNRFNATLNGIELKIRFVPRSNRGNWGLMIIESSIEDADPKSATTIAQRHCIQYDSSSKSFRTVSTSEELFLRALQVTRAKRMLQSLNSVP